MFLRYFRTFFVSALLVGVLVVVSVPQARAAEGISGQINYQGKLLNNTGSPVTDGSYNMTFSIYDAGSGGNRLWTASGTTSTPAALSITVTNGLFSINLGDVGQNSLESVNWNQSSLYLGVKISTDAEMSPRKLLTSSPYAFNAGALQGQSASSSVASTGGNLFALHQNSTNAATADRAALYIATSGTSNTYDYLIKANNGADVFTVSRQGNVTTTGNLVVQGTTTLGASTTIGGKDVCLVDGTNCLPGGGGGGSGDTVWTDNPSLNSVSLTTSTRDIAIGGTTSSTSPFFFDTQSGQFMSGSGLFLSRVTPGPVYTPVNLFLDPSIETGGTSWVSQVTGATTISATTTAYNGANAVEFLTDGSGSFALFQQAVTTTDSLPYTFSTYARGANGGETLFLVAITPGNFLWNFTGPNAGTYTTIGGAPPLGSDFLYACPLTTTYSRCTTPAISASGTQVTFAAFVGNSQGAYANQDILVDAMQVEQGSSATAFDPGFDANPGKTYYNFGATVSTSRVRPTDTIFDFTTNPGASTTTWLSMDGNGLITQRGTGIQTDTNRASYGINIPVTGTDSATHSLDFQIDGNTGLSIAATGDGAGGVGYRTITLGQSASDTIALNGTVSNFTFVNGTGTHLGLANLSVTGTVGIGTDAPSEALDVVGGISNIQHASSTFSSLTSFVTGTNPRSVVVQGKYLYDTLDVFTGGFQIFDISNPNNITLAGTLSTPASAYGLAVNGDYAYMVVQSSPNTMQIANIANPNNPVTVSTTTLSGFSTNPHGIAVSGHYAYVVDGSSLLIYDVVNPASPTLVTSTFAGTSPNSVTVSDGVAYVLDSKLRLIDVHDPVHPAFLQTVDFSGLGGTVPRGIAVENGHAFVTMSDNGYVYSVDATNPSQAPFRIGSIFLGAGSSPFSIEVQGRYAYVTMLGGTSQVRVIDINDPYSMVEVGESVSLGSSLYGLSVSGRYAYAASNNTNRVYFVDLKGTETSNLVAHSADIGAISIRQDGTVGNDFTIGNALTIGDGGIFSNGSISVSSAATSTFIGAVRSLSEFAVGPSSTHFGDGYITKTNGDLTITADRVLPGSNSIDFGSSANAWNNIHATGTIYTGSGRFISDIAPNQAGKNLLTNPSFETPGTTFAGWTDQTSGGSLIGVSAVAYHGSVAAEIITDGSGSFVGEAQDVAVGNGEQATISAYARGSLGGETMFIIIVDNTNKIWNFTGPSAGTWTSLGGPPPLTSDQTHTCVLTTSYSRCVAPAFTGNGNTPRVFFLGGNADITYASQDFLVDAAQVEIGTSATSFEAAPPTPVSHTLYSFESTMASSTLSRGDNLFSFSTDPGSNTTTWFAMDFTGLLTQHGSGLTADGQNYALNIAMASSTDVNTHEMDLQIAGTNALSISAIGDGAGSVGRRTLTVGQPSDIIQLVGNVTSTGNFDALGAMTFVNATGSNMGVTGSLSNVYSNTALPFTNLGTSGAARYVVAHGTYVYVAREDGTGGGVLDIEDLSTNTLVGSTPFTNRPHNMVVNGRYAYILETPSGKNLNIVDISNPSAPFVVSTSTVTGYDSYYHDLAVEGNYVYITTALTNSLNIIDVSNPMNPVVVTSTQAGPVPMGVVVNNGFAYVYSDQFNGGDQNLHVIDVRKPDSPVLLASTYDLTSFCTNGVSQFREDAAVKNDRLVMSFFDGSVCVINISNPNNIFPEGRTSVLNNLNAVALDDRYAYITGANPGGYVTLDVFDIGNAGAITEVASSTATSQDYPPSISVAGHRVIVPDPNVNLLTIFDLGGTEISTAAIHNALIGDLQIQNSAYANRDFTVAGVLTAGSGIVSHDSLTAFTSTSTAIFAQLAASSTSASAIEAYMNCGTSTNSFIAQFFSDSNSTKDVKSRLDCEGNWTTDGTYTSPAGDYAEYWSTTDTSITAGDVVVSTSTGMMKSNPASRAMTLGVISTKPGFVGNGGDAKMNDPAHWKIVAMLGQVPVKVDASSDPIAVGDLLMAGNNGTAVKAHGSGMVLGRALEPMLIGTGVIQAYIKPEWSVEDVFTQNFTLGATSIMSNPALLTFGSVSSGNALLTISDIGNVAVTKDLSVGGRLFLGTRTGLVSSSTYIFVDDSQSPTSTYIATNADGWQTQTTYDYAERFQSSQALDAGDLVMTDPSGINAVKQTASSTDVVLGIVSTKPGFITGAYTTGTYPIALAGRVPTKVSTLNGAIQAGDQLAPSNIPGVAVKAVSSGPVVGIALESYDKPQDGSISVFVQPGWKGGEIVPTGSSTNAIAYQTFQPGVSPRSGLARIAAGSAEVNVTFPTLNSYPLVTVTPYALPTGQWGLKNVTDHGFTIVMSNPENFNMVFAWKAEPSPANGTMSLSDGTSAVYDPLTGQLVNQVAPTSTVPVIDTTTTPPVVDTSSTPPTVDTTSTAPVIDTGSSTPTDTTTTSP